MSLVGEIFLLLLVLTFGLLHRLPFSFISGSDQWGVAVKIQKHARQKWLTYDMPDSVIPGIFPYPMLVHFMISRFPERYWKVVSLMANQGIDVLVAISVYLMLRALLPATSLTGDACIYMALGGTLLYLTTPIFFPISSRIKNSNGRCFGLMVSTIFFLALYPAMHGNYFAMAACVVLAIVSYISSFFAMQTIIFFSVGIAALYLNLIPLAIIALSLVLSFLFPQLGARDTLVFKVNHFICYAHTYQLNTTATGRSLIRNFFRFFKVFGKDRVEAFTLLFRGSPLLIALYSVPAFWLLIALAGSDEQVRALLADPFPRYCAAMVLLTFLVFLASSTGRLVIFGQSERYFEYGAPFLAVCLSLALSCLPAMTLAVTVPTLLIINLSAILFVDLSYNKRFFREISTGYISGDNLDQDIVDQMRALDSPMRIATIPVKVPILLSGFAKDSDPIKYYYRLIMKDLRIDGFKDFINDMDDVQIFGGTPDSLAKKYGITHVLCRKDHLNRTSFDFVNATKLLPLVVENERYALYAVDKHKQDSSESKEANL